jgi:hypothetical protein
VTHRGAALAAAVAVVVALWLGAATPGLASANEAPSAPALLTACATNRHGHPTAGNCPAIVRSASSAVVTSAARRLPVGTPGPLAALLLFAAAGVVAMLAVRRPPWPILGRNGARAPPLRAS